MARYLVVQEFDVEVFTDQACEAYGIDPRDLPDFIWATYPWQVHNIDLSMVYAFNWEEILLEEGVQAKEKGLPVSLQDSYAFLATPRPFFQGKTQEAA